MGRLGDDHDAWNYGLPYRRGFAAAADRKDAARDSISYGRSHGKPLDAPTIVDDLVRLLGRDAADPSVEAIRQGVEDALEGRRPRW